MVGMTESERREMQAIRNIAEKAMQELSSHTAVCAERQGELKKLVWVVIKILIGATGTALVGMAGAIANLIIHFPTGH